VDSPIADAIAELIADPPEAGAPTPAPRGPEAPGALIDYFIDGPQLDGVLPHELAELADLTDPDHISTAYGVVCARLAAVEAWWGPLLASCRDGHTTAPEADLRSVTAEARALAPLAGGEAGHYLRQKALALEHFFPLPKEQQPARKAAVQVTRPGAPVPKAPRAAPPREASPRQKMILVAAVAAILAVAVLPRLTPAPTTTPLTTWQTVVDDVLDVRIEGQLLVLVIDPTWAKGERGALQADLRALEATITGEPVNALALVAPDGRELARTGPNGHIGGVSSSRQAVR